ncbi:sodium/proton antiporter, CPA1 family [Pelagirhabdus alkalitolerans]|uniref:Sodium/proton antiporter, CPA1 family n=1 Tax=Pelagirhabdus alkalitolerans TaxID=1612202 RepID=A0A1G6KHU9_9BACI|nr:cation:proton antiporter [Pelagirhabdus alkalitolerans]SDC30544.1 sodium/proton antiporter, CPA1 family [Pelagirhabdus alkalitolerans]
MLESIALLLLLGFIMAKVVSAFKLPGLLGMLVIGVIVGPYAMDVLDDGLLLVSQDLRSFALIVILIRAGLGIKRQQLKKVGVLVAKISSIPCLLEGFTVLAIAYYWLGFSFAEAGMLGFVLAAVSPAVVVPSVLELKEARLGENKQVPTLLLTGTSIDDVFAITLFTFFLGLGTTTGNTNVFLEIVNIPFSIIFGVLGGAIIAFLLIYVFKWKALFDHQTEKMVLILSLAILYYEFGEWIGIASLLGVMTLGFVLLEKIPKESAFFSGQLASTWIFAQIILFTLVGAEVNLEVAFEAGLVGLVVILIGLVGRGVGTMVATMGSNLSYKERLFCVIAYMPKATVQAAIGSIPLASGVDAGGTILAFAVLSIVVTAPIGALLIKFTAPRLLEQATN